MPCKCSPWRVEKGRTSYRSCGGFIPGVPGQVAEHPMSVRAWVFRKPWQDRARPWRTFIGGIDVHEIVPSATRAEARAKADARLDEWCRRNLGGGFAGCGRQR